MYADFPWLNDFFAEALADPRDLAPTAFHIFYRSMNFASMYLLAFCVLLFLGFLAFLIGKSVGNELKMYSSLRLIYNFFSFGAVFAGCASLQGAILNPISTLDSNAAFYIVGIVVFFIFVFECAYKLCRDYVRHFWKIRIMAKAILLSLAHFSPVYLLSTAVLIDCMLIFLEYKVVSYPKEMRAYWIFSNVAANVSLCVLVFVPFYQITFIVVAALLLAIIAVEVAMHYFETQPEFALQKAKDDEKDFDVDDKIIVNTENAENSQILRDSQILRHSEQTTVNVSDTKKRRKFKNVREAKKKKLQVDEKNNDQDI